MMEESASQSLGRHKMKYFRLRSEKESFRDKAEKELELVSER